MGKFINLKIGEVKIKYLIILFFIGICGGFIYKTTIMMNILIDEINHSYKLVNRTNKQMTMMNQKMIIMSQQINMWKMNNMDVDHYDFETPSDNHYYNYIQSNNSFSNPLTNEQIWGIVTELKNCKNDPSLLLAIAKAESSFNASAVSKVGCIGLMQINPIHDTKYNFTKEDLLDPVKSIRIADQLITDWQKSGKLSTSEICKKYLGCHSDKYLDKVNNNLDEL